MLDKNDSYIYGLLITDGSMYLTTRNRGKVTLEISKKDEDIVMKLNKLIPKSKIYERVRNTNFKNNSVTKIFSNHQLSFRTKLISQGFPIKDKTINANTPIDYYDEYSFWRGVIDGDGSLGFIKDGTPFISLVTKSEKLKDEFLSFIRKELGIDKHLNRNKRDNIYNIVIKAENAVKLSKLLYLTDTSTNLYINRKYIKAKEMQNWKRINSKK